jgi:hypothetical protein
MRVIVIAICTLFSMKLYSQELVLYQTYQLYKNPLKKITKFDYTHNTKTETIFAEGNKVTEEKEYSLDTNELKIERSFKWNGHQIVESTYNEKPNFEIKEWLLKTDTGLVYKCQHPNKQISMIKLQPDGFKLYYKQYLTDEHYNVIGSVDTDSLNQRIVYMLDPFGNPTKKTTYLKNSKTKVEFLKHKKGTYHDEYLALKVVHCKETFVYNNEGLPIEHLLLTKSVDASPEEGYGIMIHVKWLYE